MWKNEGRNKIYLFIYYHQLCHPGFDIEDIYISGFRYINVNGIVCSMYVKIYLFIYVLE